MKIGARVGLFNYAMREARAKKGFTQAKLAEMVGVSTTFICLIEKLQIPPAKELLSRLEDIAALLERDFDELFPQEYLAYVENGKPISERPIIVCKDIPLLALPETSEYLLVDQIGEAEKRIDNELLKDDIHKLMNEMSEREKAIITLRFGLGGEKEKTLEEVSEIFRISVGRVRLIEQKALRNLRHPCRHGRLKDYL